MPAGVKETGGNSDTGMFRLEFAVVSCPTWGGL